MEKLRFDEVLYCLKEGEIVFTIDKNRATFYGRINKDTLRVYNDKFRYNLKMVDFKKLFKDEDFYLYEKREESNIDKEKDDEYYGWWHK